MQVCLALTFDGLVQGLVDAALHGRARCHRGLQFHQFSFKMFIQDEQGLHSPPQIPVACCDGIFNSRIIQVGLWWQEVNGHR